MKTVERIRRILQELGMQTEEEWGESGVPYCHSIRITVRGTTFGTNGKGLTREFALASGYGELMERLQLGYVSRDDLQKDGSFTVDGSRSEQLEAAALLEKNRKWYERYAQQTAYFTDVRMTPQELLAQFADGDGKVAVLPYFNATTGQKDYLPLALRKLIYTTNGCAAGNTLEEAIVQAIGEIVERKHKQRILTEQIAVPDIPEAVLQRYGAAYDIISYIRSRGFRVFVKDCSLGTKFPVVCVCFIDQRTGRYHTHFGAYPVFEIALERALTESFQGRNIGNFAKYDDFSYEKANARSLNEMTKEFVKGESEKLPEFFLSAPEQPWQETCGFTGKNNRELLKECLAFFAQQDYEVLMRDYSCLGFPTVQVIIPGYSEIFSHRFSSKHNDLRFWTYAAKVLRNPAQAKPEDMLALFMHINQSRQLAKHLSALKFTVMARLSALPTAEEEAVVEAASMGYVCYRMGKPAETAKCIQNMIPLCPQEDQEYLICLKRYLSMQVHGYTKEQIRTLLELCHKSETVSALYACVEGGGNPLEKFTLHCDAGCDADCPLYRCCYQQQANQMAKTIVEKTGQMDFEVSAAQLRCLIQ